MSTLSAAVDLPPTASAISSARRLAVATLRAWGAPHDLEDAGLLVTELVANVVDHVGGEASFTLELTLAGAWLRVGVVDGSAIRPVVREMDRAAPRGRGMQLVAAIADRWGAEDCRDGKRVWFELRPSPGEAGAGLPASAAGDGRGETPDRGGTMSEPTGHTESAGEGLSDEEMIETVAGQTDSVSPNADVAGKDWEGDASSTPAPDGRG